MNRRTMGIRLVAGLIVAGGLGAGSIGSTLAAPGNLGGEGLTITARFEKCTEGSPDDCKQIQPEEPSKRGGKPKQNRPPRGGTIEDPPKPPSNPPTGGRIRKDDPPKREDPWVPRTIRTTGGDSEPFVAKHQEIPVVASNRVAAAPVASAPVAPAPVVAQDVAKPVVAEAPSAGTGPVAGGAMGMPALLAALAAMFGAGAVYVSRQPEPTRIRK